MAVGAGGFVTGFSADRRGATRVLRTDVYGAYRWLQDEQRWAQLVTKATMPAAMQMQGGANEGVFELVVAPSDPSRLYMAIKGLLLRSTNGGGSFTATAPLDGRVLDFDPNSEYRNHGPFIGVSPSDPDLVIFGTPRDGVWRTEDGGRRWSRVSSVPQSADLPGQLSTQRAPALTWFRSGGANVPEAIWVMSPGHGMYMSRDRGLNFAPLSSSGGPKMLKQGSFAVDGTFFGVDGQSESVWRYKAGAWANLTQSGRIKPQRYAAIAVDTRTAAIWVFDEGGRTQVSRDAGESWWPVLHRSRVGPGDPAWLHVSDQSYFAIGQVAFDPVMPGRLWAGAGTGIYFAEVPGYLPVITWTSQSRGIEELVANDAVKPPGQALVVAAWDFGIHVKEDLDRFSSTYGPKERVLIAAQQLAWSPADPAFLVTNASDTRTGCCSEDGDAVLAGFSTDGGRHWRRFESLPQPPGTRPDDPWRMSFGAIAVSASDTRNIVWAPSFNRSPFYTLDRGATWQRVVLPGEKTPLTGSHSAYHFHRKTVAADGVAPATFYLVHSGEGENAALTGLWRTPDGGATWQRAFRGEIAPGSQSSAKLRVVPGQRGHLFFTSGVYGGTDTRLRRSRDAGHSWTALTGVDQVDDVAFGKALSPGSYPTVFVSGRVAGVYGIWRSVDDAVSWQRVGTFPVGSLDQVTVMAGDPDVFGKVYLGYKGSGWAYGQPSTCRPRPYRFPADTECAAVQ
ncbi:MAG: hypothetical protein EON92_03330 [Burkholderiales bacterium]|nr:MAG: hypothetical protein EON92_03330 [Burkholderiales bacterium]